MLAALGEFDDPEVKKAVIEIAHSDDYPVDIRKKAIDNLAAFNDPSVVDGLLPLLEHKENYIYYDNIKIPLTLFYLYMGYYWLRLALYCWIG